MSDVITLGRRLILLRQIAYVETFDPASNPDFTPEKPFKARVVLKDLENVLTEFDPQDFVRMHGFYWLTSDEIALNINGTLGVEMFTPTEKFSPAKPYTTRLKWRDGDGVARSKLLITGPDDVIEALNSHLPSTRIFKPAGKSPAKPRKSRTPSQRRASPD